MAVILRTFMYNTIMYFKNLFSKILKIMALQDDFNDILFC